MRPVQRLKCYKMSLLLFLPTYCHHSWMWNTEEKTEAARDWQCKSVSSSTHEVLSGKPADWFAFSFSPHILWKDHLFTVGGVLIPNPPCSPFLNPCNIYKACHNSNKVMFLSSAPCMPSFILKQLYRTLLNLHNYPSLLNCDGLVSNSWAWKQICQQQILWSSPTLMFHPLGLLTISWLNIIFIPFHISFCFLLITQLNSIRGDHLLYLYLLPILPNMRKRLYRYSIFSDGYRMNKHVSSFKSLRRLPKNNASELWCMRRD